MFFDFVKKCKESVNGKGWAQYPKERQRRRNPIRMKMTDRKAFIFSPATRLLINGETCPPQATAGMVMKRIQGVNTGRRVRTASWAGDDQGFKKL
jgi:hypothetical protein